MHAKTWPHFLFHYVCHRITPTPPQCHPTLLYSVLCMGGARDRGKILQCPPCVLSSRCMFLRGVGGLWCRRDIGSAWCWKPLAFFFFYTSIRCPEGATEVLCLSGSEARVREPEPEAPAYGALQRSASCVRGELFTGMLQDILLSWYWMLICADEINHILKQSIVVVFLLSPMFIYFTACSMNLWVSFTSYLSGVG